MTWEMWWEAHLKACPGFVHAKCAWEARSPAIDAARGVMNCLAEDDTYVAMHDSPGSCLDILRRAISDADKPSRRRKAVARR